MKTARTISLLIVFGIPAAWLIGCHGNGYETALKLDKVAKSVERYGFASISTPFLTAPSSQFAFDLNRSAAEYYADALKPQGFVRGSDSSAFVAQASVAIEVEKGLQALAQIKEARSAAQKARAMEQANRVAQGLEVAAQLNPALSSNSGFNAILGLLQSETDSSSEGSGDTEDADDSGDAEDSAAAGTPEEPQAEDPPFELPSGPPIPKDNLIGLNAVGPFTPTLGNPSDAPTLSAGEAILIASHNRVSQGLLNWISHPVGNKQGNYELFYCPMVVSVQPGWDTRQGYQADITVTVDLARQSDSDHPKCIEYASDHSPLVSPPIQVVGAYPMVDGQVLDLVSSRRRLYSMAFALAMRGFGSQGQFFTDYAKRLENDAKTRTSLTTASAYTLGGNAFGFRVGPQFVALDTSGEHKRESNNQLQSRTFPALAVVLVYRDLLQTKGKPCDPDYCEKYDRLVFRSGVRWTPVKRGTFDLLGPKRYSEVEAWQRARDLDAARQNTKPGAISDQLGEFERQHLQSRVATLRNTAVDATSLVYVQANDLNAKVEITDVQPRHGWLDASTVLTIYGKNFAGSVTTVAVGGRECKFHPISDSCILAIVPPFSEPDKGENALSTAAATATQELLATARELNSEIAYGTNIVGGSKHLATNLTSLMGEKGVIAFASFSDVGPESPDNIREMLDNLESQRKSAGSLVKAIEKYIAAAAFEAAREAADGASKAYKTALDQVGNVRREIIKVENATSSGLSVDEAGTKGHKLLQEMMQEIALYRSDLAKLKGRLLGESAAVEALKAAIGTAESKHIEALTLVQKARWARVDIAANRGVKFDITTGTERDPATLQKAGDKKNDKSAAWILFDKRVKSSAKAKSDPKSLEIKLLYDKASEAKALPGMPTGVQFPSTTDPEKVIELLQEMFKKQGGMNIVTEAGVRVGPAGTVEVSPKPTK